MITPDVEEPTEADIPDAILAGKEGRERITAAIASVLPPESRIDAKSARDGSYRVRVRARIDQAATCHGRDDDLDLLGGARLDGDAFEVRLEGTDRVTEDICSVNGRGRDFVARRNATATFRIAKRCSATISDRAQ